MSTFVQEFSAWLLPYLALLSQLPFGANDRWENLSSVLLTVGSPALAAYSIAITVLNDRWLARLFSPYSYPNSGEAIRILSNLQQSPLGVNVDGCLLPSLVVLEYNDKWWHDLAGSLEYSQSWSMSAAMSIAWVVVAYVFTVIDSLDKINSDNAGTEEVNSSGQAVGALWFWLLPVVTCWLQLSPKCDNKRVGEAIERANSDDAYAATESEDNIVPASRPGALHILGNDQRTALYADQHITVPIYNYSRLFTWTSAVQSVAGCFSEATRHARSHEPVNPEADWLEGDSNVKIRAEYRSGTSLQIEAYCFLDPRQRSPHLDSSIWSRMFVSYLAALFLQWGTARAATWTVYSTPTAGFGCRSGAYLLYTVTATVASFMLVSSSILAHYATAYSSQLSSGLRNGAYKALPAVPPTPKSASQAREMAAKISGWLSILLRRSGKFLAVSNAVWITVICSFQFTGFFDRCYCDGSVIGRGENNAYVVLTLLKPDIEFIKVPWIGGVFLAVGTSALFVIFINLKRPSLRQ
ncbi:hypothetical protein V5O48_001605 [Marasmius crinis-equi]|uniref:Uncharacterized protein n=1 Tax=Marasmius crinis-equi TaxID=585013 RepID=A0ABR3FYK6_9AGAR